MFAWLLKLALASTFHERETKVSKSWQHQLIWQVIHTNCQPLQTRTQRHWQITLAAFNRQKGSLCLPPNDLMSAHAAAFQSLALLLSYRPYSLWCCQMSLEQTPSLYLTDLGPIFQNKSTRNKKPKKSLL